MIQIRYTNGDVQNINVTADFFHTSAEFKKGKKEVVTPRDKAESLSLDLAQLSGRRVHSVTVFYSDSHQTSGNAPMDYREPVNYGEDRGITNKLKREFKKKLASGYKPAIAKWTF